MNSLGILYEAADDTAITKYLHTVTEGSQGTFLSGEHTQTLWT